MDGAMQEFFKVPVSHLVDCRLITMDQAAVVEYLALVPILFGVLKSIMVNMFL